MRASPGESGVPQKTHTLSSAAGQAFERNEYYERLLALLDQDPGAVARLSPAARLALGYYQRAKASHEAEEG